MLYSSHIITNKTKTLIVDHFDVAIFAMVLLSKQQSNASFHIRYNSRGAGIKKYTFVTDIFVSAQAMYLKE